MKHNLKKFETQIYNDNVKLIIKSFNKKIEDVRFENIKLYTLPVTMLIGAASVGTLAYLINPALAPFPATVLTGYSIATTALLKKDFKENNDKIRRLEAKKEEILNIYKKNSEESSLNQDVLKDIKRR